jgi:alpha-beta hydrolase superfamily lysophospholipase
MLKGSHRALAVTLKGRFVASSPSLFVRTVEADRAWGRLLLTHASMVHSEYYLPLAVRLAEAGLSVWLPDLRGHGRSGGPRGHVRHWREHVEDVRAVFDEMRRDVSDGTVLLAGGESYGGLISYWATETGVVRPDGLVLLSPAFRLYYEPPSWLWHLMDRVGRSVAPRLRPWRPLSHRGVSADPAVDRMIDRDPLCVRHYTLGFLINLLDAQRAAGGAPPVAVPTLAVLSRGDAICDNRGAEAVLSRCPDADVVTLDGPQHSLVADRPSELYATLAAWLDRRTEQLVAREP